MSAFKVCLFGAFSTLQNDRPWDCFPSAKAKELLCFLLLHRDRPHAREALATTLWGECTSAQSKKYLRQTLWQLHQALQALASTKGDNGFLQVDMEHIRFDSREDLWFDVGIFEQAFAAIQGIAGEHLKEHQAEALRKAVSLYQGNLLDGWYQDWCLYHRERLENNYLAMLDKLMAYSENHHDYESGLAFGERLLYQDRARERTYYRLMRLHYLAGDRAGALRQFQRCAAALKEELGIEPAKRTTDLFEQIRADHMQGVPPEPSGIATLSGKPRSNEPDHAAGPLLRRLRRLRSVLLKIQHRVETDIHEVDELLDAPMESTPSQKH
jgi:DNA-binding SARP family transcriptional activator